MLHHKAQCTGIQCTPCVSAILVHGQKYHFDFRIIFLETTQRFDAIEAGHGDICDDNVRLQLFRGGHQRWPIRGRPGNFKLIAQQGLQTLDDHLMIVSQEHPRTRHDVPP